MNLQNADGEFSVFKLSMYIVVGLVGITVLFGSFGTVDTGYRGVVVKLGNPTGEIKEQGFYTKLPFVTDVVEMNVQVLKEEVDASAASKDLQDVKTKVAVNYRLNSGAVGTVYQEVRKDWSIRLVQPALQESIKAATANYTAEELITKRAEVRTGIETNLREKMVSRGIIVDNVNIINFDFSPSFNAAIEKKVTAEQDALAAKNKLEQIKYEAQQSIEKAKGEAESIRIQSQALTDQPQFLDKMAIEKWDGTLPTYLGAGAPMPFINVK